MYDSIGVPVHPSRFTRKAIAIARALADRFDGEVTGLSTSARSATRGRLDRLAALLPGVTEPDLEPVTGGATLPLHDLPFPTLELDGSPFSALRDAVKEGEYDLLVVPAVRDGETAHGGIGPLCERLVRRVHVDTLIIKDEGAPDLDEPGHILVCIDGSQESYAGLKQAFELARRFGKTVEAIGVYDPYLHYTLFNGIVNVLTEEASRVFKFADQEKLHEEIIDTGLAKIYQAHLDVARKVAQEEGMELRATLLDGKAFSKVLKHANRTRPWLLVMGRIGVHSDVTMDIGATSENLLRTVPCDVLLTSSRFMPPVDVQAEASIEWTPAARQKMERVPSFVKGVATMSIIRWAMERGHSIITPSVINGAMGDLLPPSAAQAMGYVAEELAIHHDRLAEGQTFLCPECGHAARDFRPAVCPVCRTEGKDFEQIDRATLAELGKLESGALEEEMFDGKRLSWTKDAKEVLRRVPSGYERRRAKARIEKTARVRGLETIGKDFAIDMVEQELADNAYLSKRGDHVEIKVREDEKADDAMATPRSGSAASWTDAAWQRICRVPQGFMRDMTRERVEQFAAKGGVTRIDLASCEDGITEGRRMMAEMLGSYGGDSSKVMEVLQAAAPGEPRPVPSLPAEEVAEEVPASGCPMGAATTSAAEAAQEGSACPVSHAATTAHEAPAGETSATGGGCPVAHGGPAASPDPRWTPEAEAQVKSAVARAADAGKFSEVRAEHLTRGVGEERARERRLEQIGESFMRKLGTQLGYGHPLSEKTAEFEFEWTPEAEARLTEVPEFCREMTRWRVEWTAVKKDLGRVITPEIMDVKYEMWGEISDGILEREGEALAWDDDASERLARIPDFVKGQVLQSVEGNARAWGFERVTAEVLDRVIDKWIRTGDFHEAQYGYK